ncbi:OmpA/MotB family protein [Nitrosomonas sp. ANs5]|uniref:OmpA/MotB family protein n=1 Tax=Nitrosomonas sp. ANs5 TaxID=3423941 RepID=UPI003D32543E
MADDDSFHVGKERGRYAHWNFDPPADTDEDSWLIVYLDVMTLLLVMLVVLLAFSDRILAPHAAAQHVSADRSDTPYSDTAQKAATSAVTLKHAAEGNPLAGLPLDTLGDDVEILIQEGAISFRISNEILFPSGQSMLTVPGVALLDRLTKVLNATEHKISVEGHTDNVPIQTARFPSNWELSTGRATSVVRHLERSGVASRRLRATGYADTRPIALNGTPEGRATNRRVELILETRPH